MTTRDFVHGLCDRGVCLHREADRLVFRAPSGVLTYDDRMALEERKPEILAILPDELARRAPAMAAFLAAVAGARCSEHPGLIRMSSEIVELWRAAEREAGDIPIDLAGRPRKCKPRTTQG